MQTWERRILGALALGGGFLGVTIAFALLLSPGLVILARALVLSFMALYCWGAWCGLRMLEGDETSLKANRLFWALQIPYVMSPIGGYFFASGFLLYVTFRPSDMNIGAMFRLGSQFEYSILQADKPLIFGLNLFAIAIVGLLSRRIRSTPSNSSFKPNPPRYAIAPDGSALISASDTTPGGSA
jgi:hypothetical protein